MPSTVIPLSEAGPWVAALGKRMPEAAKRGLLAAANRLVGTIKQLELPTDRGIARAGWRAEPIENGAAVFNTVLQAVLQEGSVRGENVKVGRAMIDALAAWARRKGLEPDQEQGERPTSGKARTEQQVQRRIKPPEEAYRSIAFAIANSMKKRGIFYPELRGLKTLERTTKTLGPDYVRQEVVREIRREFI